MSKEALQERSEKWLRTWCEVEGDVPGYDEMMDAIDHSGGEYVSFGEDAGGEIPAAFWYHYEIVTGVHLEHPPMYISCAC